VNRVPSALAVLALVAIAACGGGDDEEEAAPTTTTTAAPAYPASVEPVPSGGCGTSTATAVERERHTLEIAGEERWYLLSVPSGHDGTTPMPMVLDLHGLSEGAEIAAAMGQLDQLGETEGFVSVFPHGSGAPVKWDVHIDDATPNHDMEMITEILDSLGDDLCLDEARTYVTGLSYGAIMSSSLGCTMADRFAAIAPVAGIVHPEGCEPTRPIPVLTMHGTVDPILLFNGGVGDLGAALSGGSLALPDGDVDLHGAGYPAAVDEWAATNGCGESTDEDRTATIIERTYDCPEGAEVRFLIIEGGGHSWPGSEFSAAIESVVGPTTTELDATEEIWSFFTDHARPPS
jgi:polyhydroxybutyrate depolymerase